MSPHGPTGFDIVVLNEILVVVAVSIAHTGVRAYAAMMLREGHCTYGTARKAVTATGAIVAVTMVGAASAFLVYSHAFSRHDHPDQIIGLVSQAATFECFVVALFGAFDYVFPSFLSGLREKRPGEGPPDQE